MKNKKEKHVFAILALKEYTILTENSYFLLRVIKDTRGYLLEIVVKPAS